MKPLASNQPLDFYVKSGTLKTISLLAIAASIFAINGRSAAIANDLRDQASLTTEPIPSSIPSPELLADSSNSPIPNPQSPIPNPQSPIPNPQSPIPNPQSPIPNPQSPIPNPQSPIPNPQSPIPNPQSPNFHPLTEYGYFERYPCGDSDFAPAHWLRGRTIGKWSRSQ